MAMPATGLNVERTQHMSLSAPNVSKPVAGIAMLVLETHIRSAVMEVSFISAGVRGTGSKCNRATV